MAAANWIVNVESMVARETNPMENLVCTIGVINGGDRYNVGCGDVYLEGTCRTYEPAKRDYIERRLGESLQALDLMYKTKSTLDYKRGHGATTNDPDAIDYATSIVEKYLGKDDVVHPEHPSMAAEDFSAYLHKIKGAFLWLGTGFEGNPALHNAGFTIDEKILESGITMMAALAAEYLQPKE